MTFKQYLLQEYGNDWQAMQMNMIHHDYTVEKMNDEQDKLREEFEEYLEDNDIEETPE